MFRDQALRDSGHGRGRRARPRRVGAVAVLDPVYQYSRFLMTNRPLNACRNALGSHGGPPFDQRLAKYHLPQDTKALFGQALDAHGHGLYRLAARSLFPEVERLAREELHAGAMDDIASQRSSE